ncbi:MAG: transcription antitermination factor NusB [Alphaproteobacteria bacterium]|nr:transcription antitermination factor NusB [Alphaproteobacteria bacterium]
MSAAAKPPRPPVRKRTAARLAAVQALYQIELAGVPADTVVDEFLAHRLAPDAPREEPDFGEADRALFADLTRGAAAQRDALDRAIAAALSPDWPLARLDAVLRAILRVGAYELTHRRDVPPEIAINEYIDIAHAFFAEKEPGLVNGVLDRMAHDLRPEEMGRSRGGEAAR